MLQELESYLKQDNNLTVQCPEWTQFVNSIIPYRDAAVRRYMQLNSIPHTKGVQLLKHILSIADPVHLAKLGDNFYIYSTQISGILDTCLPMFERNRSGIPNTKTFAYCQKDTSLPEYIIADLDNVYIKTLPLNSTSMSDWKDVSPIELLDYGGYEQTFDMYTTGMLRFHIDTPTHVYWSLNIPALVLKAVQCVRNKEYSDPTSFIKKEIFLHIIQQSINVWLMKLHQQVLDTLYTGSTIKDILQQYTRTQTQYSYIGSRLPYAVQELHNLYASIRSGKIPSRSVLHMPFYPDKNNHIKVSYVGRYEYMSEHCDVSNNIRYRHLVMLRDIPYLDYLIKVSCLNPEHPASRSFIYQLRTLASKWRTNTPLSSIATQAHKGYILSKFSSWDYITRT